MELSGDGVEKNTHNKTDRGGLHLPPGKHIKVHPKWGQFWVFVGRTNAEAETPTLLPAAAKSWLTWKDPDAGKDWGQEEKGTTEDEMVGRHHHQMGLSLGKLWELVMDRRAAVHGVAETQTQLSDWTALKHIKKRLPSCYVPFFFTNWVDKSQNVRTPVGSVLLAPALQGRDFA